MSTNKPNIPHDIHLPAPSIQPLVLALGVLLVAVGVLTSVWLIALGLSLALIAVAIWTQENRQEALAQAEQEARASHE